MAAKQEVLMEMANSGNSGGVNPAQSDTVRAELYVDSESTGIEREQPPPYTEQPPRTIIRETVIIQPPLKDSPLFYPCPRCRKRVLTKVEYVNTKKTHMLAGFVCGLTCWCLLCCLAALPYIIPTFKKIEHYCPDCNTFLGDYSKV